MSGEQSSESEWEFWKTHGLDFRIVTRMWVGKFPEKFRGKIPEICDLWVFEWSLSELSEF